MANFGNGITLAEDSGGWVAGDDPEDIDTTDFTAEGDDYWYAQYATVEHAGEVVMDFEDIPGWTGIDTSMEEGHDLIKVVGTYQGTSFSATQDKEDALQEFFRNHSSLGDSAFYLVKRWSADHYKKFPNEDRTMKKYMKAKFVAQPVTKVIQRVLEFSFVLRSFY